MALTSTLQQWMMKTLPGMTNKIEDLEQSVKVVELAQNGRFEDEPGTFAKRPPLTYYNSTTKGSGAVMGLKRFYTSSGTIKSIMIHGTSVYVGTDSSGTWTALTLPQGLTLTEGKRTAFEVYKDLLIMSNGSDNVMAYDGASDNVAWELGACKAVLASGGSNLDNTAIYYYAVVFNTAADGSGSNFGINGALSNPVTTDASNRKVTLSEIPIGPATALSRVVYRVEGGGSALKLLAVITDNSTTTYADDIADGSLGTAYPTVVDDFPKGNILKIHRERLFISGDPNAPNKIYYSDPYLPWYISHVTDTRYMEIEKNDNDEIMGIPIQLGTMLCIKKNSIRKLHITTPVSGTDPTTWYADDPIAWEGSPCQWSITQTPYGVIMLGWNHWKLFNGAQLIDIIDEFDISDMLPSTYSNVVGFFHNGIFLAAYGDKSGANNYHDKIMRWNFLRKALSIDTYTRIGTDTGINCFTSYSGDDESGDLYMGDSRNGFVYRSENNPQWMRWTKKSQINADSTVEDIYVGGTEDQPWIEIGRTGTIDELTGTIDNLTGTIDMPDDEGAITFGAMNLRAGAFDRLLWNEDLHNDSDTVEFWMRTGATEAAVEDGTSISAVNTSTETLTSVAHGLIAADRVEINGTVVPTGLDSQIMYYVLYTDVDNFQVSLTSGGSAVDITAAGTAPTFKKWEGPYTNSVGTDISSLAAGDWAQLKITMGANSTAGSPRVYFADGYVIRLSYTVGGTPAESAVEYIYDVGYRNFDTPFIDKIHKKLATVHDSDEDAATDVFTIYWETEHSSDSFTVDQATFAQRWESFFPDTAMGRELKIRIYKNDLNDFTLKEIKGLYTPEPIIV